MAAWRHSFTTATITAHYDVVAALRAMPRLAWTVAAILVAETALELALAQVIPRSSLFGRDIASIAYYALNTPFFIAIHRFIVLGEVTRGYRLDWRNRRFQIFFGWAFVMFALTRVVATGGVLPKHWTVQLLALVAVVAICVVLVRIVILFPAIAVDAPGATPRNAFDDTRGHGWYIFFLFVVPFIPSATIVALIAVMAVSLHRVIGSILLLPLLGLVVLVWLTLAVVLASRLYQALGDRLNRAVSSA